MSGIKIIGTGSYLPPNVVTNEMMAAQVDTNDEWIRSRTGIRSRHLVTDDTCLSMARKAAVHALEQAGIDCDAVGLVIAGTITNHYLTPSLACLLQRDLALPGDILAFDVNAACCGFLYGLKLAQKLLPDLVGRYALVIGCEELSRIVDYNDRSTCVLFGDGAGAAVVAAREGQPFHFYSGARGDSETLYCPAPTGQHPFGKTAVAVEPSFVHMDGGEVFRFAVESFCRDVKIILQQANLTIDEIDLFICHQANERILLAAAKRLGVPAEKFYANIATCGNTSAASIPIVLDEVNRAGRLVDGSRLMMVGFGGGLTHGAAYFTW